MDQKQYFEVFIALLIFFNSVAFQVSLLTLFSITLINLLGLQLMN